MQRRIIFEIDQELLKLLLAKNGKKWTLDLCILTVLSSGYSLNELMKGFDSWYSKKIYIEDVQRTIFEIDQELPKL